MKFCSKCGEEIADDVKFCNHCGAKLEVLEETSTTEKTVIETENIATPEAKDSSTTLNEDANTVEAGAPVKEKKKFVFTKQLGVIAAAALVVLIVAGIIIGNVINTNKYKNLIEETYSTMKLGAEKAEDYASLESKVWRNCIYEQESTETDKYTQNEYGRFYSDFNDALSSFYAGESLNYSLISLNVTSVNNSMSDLKDCPKKYEDEYDALKQLYISYSDLTKLVVGNTSHSLNSFSDALNTAIEEYNSDLSAARLVLE